MIAHQKFPLALILLTFLLAILIGSSANAQDVCLRVMTFNIQDVRHSEAQSPGNERLERIAEVIQRVRPNVLLLNEIELYQGPGRHLSTAEHFIHNYLMVAQAQGLEPIEFTSLRMGSNTGIPTGLDLDQSGTIDSAIPFWTNQQKNEIRDYGADCFGYGTFPGQYAMALLIDPQLTVDPDSIRTFQQFLWKNLPDALPPTNPDGSAYYPDEVWDIFRLSSKTFADVPIGLPNGATVHALISHPTPPAFDGPETKNKHRNRDEIKLIRAYIDGNTALLDDNGIRGGLEHGASFVILGDLNADPVDGSSIGDPMNTFLFESDLLATHHPPRSEIQVDGLDPTDTSSFRLRVDYVLPSSGLSVLDSGVWRHGVHHENGDGFASDHFPVWVDLSVPSQ